MMDMMVTRNSQSAHTGNSRGTAGERTSTCSFGALPRPTLRPTPRPRARFGGTDGPRPVALSARSDPDAGPNNINISLVNLVKTADDLVPFSRDSPSLGMLVWQALQREADDPRTLLSLNDVDIERLWRLADGEQRDHRTVEYRIWDDLPMPTAGRPTVRFRARTTGSTIGARFQQYTLSCDVEYRERDGCDGEGKIIGWVDDPVRRALAVLCRPFPFLPKMLPRHFKALVGTTMAGSGTCDMLFDYESPTNSVDRQSVDTERQFVRVAGPKVFVAMEPHARSFTLLIRTS